MKKLVALAILLCGSLFAEVFVEPSHPSLSQPVKEVPADEITSSEIQQIIDRMYVIAGGEREDPQTKVMVGLAAPQIGIDKQIILVDTGSFENRELGELRAFINPKIVWSSDEVVIDREGCYSVDSRLCGLVPRAEKIKITAYDCNGNLLQEEFSGFAARVFQHEVHHLQGVRFPDHMGPDGDLHWVEEERIIEYRTGWQTWPVRVSWDAWLAMKEGRPFEISSQQD